jgi:hypothetical protein
MVYLASEQEYWYSYRSGAMVWLQKRSEGICTVATTEVACNLVALKVQEPLQKISNLLKKS